MSEMDGVGDGGDADLLKGKGWQAPLSKIAAGARAPGVDLNNSNGGDKPGLRATRLSDFEALE